MTLLDVCPTSPVDDTQDDLFGHFIFCGEFERAGASSGVSLSNLANLLFRQFRAGVVLAFTCFGIFSVIAKIALSQSFQELRRMCAMPCFTSASAFRHCVSTVVLSCALSFSSSSLTVAVFGVVGVGPFKEMGGPDTSGIVAMVTNEMSGLSPMFEEERNTMSEKGHYFSFNCPSHAAVTPDFARCPYPALSFRTVPFLPIYFLPEPFESFSRQRRYVSVHTNDYTFTEHRGKS